MALLHEERLSGVSPKLGHVVRGAAAVLPFDVTIAEGVRSSQRQHELYAQGRTAPGHIVTWTLHSKHMVQVDGFGHAVDLYAIVDHAIDATKADKIASAMIASALAAGTAIRWGADWNHNGRPHEKGETDSPHFELG